ncbi:hypothetical protein BDM02DRAFT_3183707 [Thelephora ganbajun]|uniref:Uncharacterized protein n=1 Tax=Thelephora ganbajun TaxID=370292 RepID=A0ACB6ZRB2_THEGA|nr:hypothetical protein BDM02DRAFT_3183707 [Thelephora ganbajun]
MSFNKVSRASISSVTGSSHGRINGSRFVQGQNEPRTKYISTGSKSDGHPQGRVSQAGGLNSRGTNANQCTHHAPASSSHPVLSQKDCGPDVPEWVGESEPNFLDLALEESDDDSDNEWEEVAYTIDDTAVDRPLIASVSGFTLPTRGELSEFLTLEVVEDWQPPSLPSTSHPNGAHAALPENIDSRFDQELSGERDDSFEAELQLEIELAEGLADLNTPAPGPSRHPQPRTPNATNTSPPARSPVHLEFEVVEQPSLARTFVNGNAKMVDRDPTERPHKIRKRADPPRVSLIIEDSPTRKPTVSFKEKAIELARSTGRLLPSSKPLPPRNPTVNPPSSTIAGPSSAPNDTPHPYTQAASNSQLFTSKGFSHHAQNLRERQTKDNLQRFHERYGGIIVDHARRDLTHLASTFIPPQSPESFKVTQPTRRRQVQKTAGGKRISKAQAQAEEVMKICRSTKSYIVDMAAIKRREASTLPEPQHPTPATAPSSARLSSTRSETMVPAIVSRRTSKPQPAPPLSVPQLPSQLLSTSLGYIPQELKFTRKRTPVTEPGEITVETDKRVAPPERDICEPGLASTNNGPLTMDALRRKRKNSGGELEGSSPRKKLRLGRS